MPKITPYIFVATNEGYKILFDIIEVSSHLLFQLMLK
jgi:hypothetical protein